MRKLYDSFMSLLQTGFLAALTRHVVEDIDLDIEIRSNAINIYYQ